MKFKKLASAVAIFTILAVFVGEYLYGMIKSQ